MFDDKLTEAFAGVDKALDFLRDEVKRLRAENLMLKAKLRDRARTMFYWLAETSDQSHKYLIFPGGELTPDPWKATRYDTKEKCMEVCALSSTRWMNLMPVEHGFDVENS